MWLIVCSVAWALPSNLTVSWYGERFAGRPTASGELFDPKELTAAHKTLPFDTRLKLTHLETGKTVVVRVNDRGPFVKGRDLDVSRAAAEALGFIDKGVTTLKVSVVKKKTKRSKKSR